jgi:hypothetical protein
VHQLKKQEQIKTLDMGLNVPHRGVEGAGLDANKQQTNIVIHTTHLFLY